MQLARIEAGDNGYRTATAGLARKPRCIWGRRSRFQLRGKPLLVNEIFLPSIPAFANALNPAHGSGYCD
jgi:chorismate--pyruvate lyase